MISNPFSKSDGLQHFTSQMIIDFNEGKKLLDQLISRWVARLYPDDDEATPYQDSPAPRRDWRRRY